VAGAVALVASQSAMADNRASTSKKGSLLAFPSYEVKWEAGLAGGFVITQDTFLQITNDYFSDVWVHFLFVDGDDPTPAETCCNPPIVTERAHAGWKKQNWTHKFTHDQSDYFSIATGQPAGASPISNLDNGPEGPGRPDDETGGRVLRGFVLAWAVDVQGREISWNHLSGNAVTINYVQLAASEYAAYAYQTVSVTTEGMFPDMTHGELNTDGVEYDYDFDKLLLDFYSEGSSPFGAITQVRTELSLLPMEQDLRQNNGGPVYTKASFDVWNQREDFFSGSHRCLYCWDQFYLGDISLPNNFTVGILGTNTGKARIDGHASDTECDAQNCCDQFDESCQEDYFDEHGTVAPICSEDTPLTGVARKEIAFSGAVPGWAHTARSLTGQGQQDGWIKANTVAAPQPQLDGDETNAGPERSIRDSKRTPRSLSDESGR
jgi:hypothetical protein